MLINLIARFRGGLLRLEVNEGRWSNIPYEYRRCTICNKNSIEDEKHMLFDCSAWNDFRQPLNKFTNFRNRQWDTSFTNSSRVFS